MGKLCHYHSTNLLSIPFRPAPSPTRYSHPKKRYSPSSLEDLTHGPNNNQGLPPIPRRHAIHRWNESWPLHTSTLTNHITHKDIMTFRSLFPNAVFHNEDKKASSPRIYCPCLYYTCLTNTFADINIFKPLDSDAVDIIQHTLEHLTTRYKKSYIRGPLAKDGNFPMPTCSPRGRSLSILEDRLSAS